MPPASPTRKLLVEYAFATMVSSESHESELVRESIDSKHLGPNIPPRSDIGIR